MKSAEQLLIELGYGADPHAPHVLDLVGRLVDHELYHSLTNVARVRTFMCYQVWCVWDFMCLAKSVQVGVGCYQVPWVPPIDTALVRAMNGILEGEEADIGPDGKPASHLEIFIAAMEEAQADSAPIKAFVADLRSGMSFEDAATKPDIPLAARAFMQTTMAVTAGPLHCRVASFCLTREELVPRMFRNFIPKLPQAREQMSKFLWYLERHVELDTQTHGPHSQTLLRGVVGNDPIKRSEALAAVVYALEARLAYLDDTLGAVRATTSPL